MSGAGPLLGAPSSPSQDEDSTRTSSEQIEGATSKMAEEMVNKLTQEQIRYVAEALEKDLTKKGESDSKSEAPEEDPPQIDPEWILGAASGGETNEEEEKSVYVLPEDRFTVNELKLAMGKEKFVSSTADKELLAVEHAYCVEKKLPKGESKVTEEKRVLRSSTRPAEVEKNSDDDDEKNESERLEIRAVDSPNNEDDDDDDDEEEEEEDNNLYCLCRKPHQNRFMICCDQCQEWYHGDCVGISVERGQEMDMNDEEYTCPRCQKKAKEKKLLREKAMQTKKRELEKKRAGKHELRRRDASVLETVQLEMRNQKALTRTRIGGRHSTLIDYDEDDDWLPRQRESQEEEEEREASLQKKSKSTEKVTSSGSARSRTCLNPSCTKLCRGDTLYCSEECIKKYARSALNRLAQIAAHQKSTSFASQTSSANAAADRVTVIDRNAGRSVGGMAAPKKENLASYLLAHPMCEVSFKSAASGQAQKDLKSKESKSRSDSVSDDHKPKLSMNIKLVRSNVVKSLKQILLDRNQTDRVEIEEKDVLLICQKIEKQLYRVHDGVGQKYKAKYRTLMFNLKDPKNPVLYKDVLTGRLKPSEIVTLSSEELASKELAKWRKEENKKTLELIKAAELEAANEKIKITKMTHKGEIEIEEINVEKSSSGSGGVVDVLSMDTTAQHQSHVFSVNCRICTGVEEAPHFAKEEKKKAEIQKEKEEISPLPPPPQDFNVMDIDIRPPSPLAPLPPETPEWKGVVNMQGVAKFIATANVVSGTITKRSLSGLLPDSCSVQGRIAENQVWDYIKKLKYSSNRDVCMIRFEPGSNDEKGSFLELFTYMKEKHRFVVVVNCQLPIKDMYLMPFSPTDTLPDFLRPLNGPGLPESRPDLILGIIVKQSSTNKPPKRHHHHHHHHSKSSKKHRQTIPDEAPVNLAKKGYFQAPSLSPNASPTSISAPSTSSPPPDVRYSPSTEVYSPSQPSIDDDVTSEATSKPSSAVSAILSVAMARVGPRTEIPLIGEDSATVSSSNATSLGNTTTSGRLPPPPAPPPPPSTSVESADAPAPPILSDSLIQAVKAMSSDTLQNIAQAVGLVKPQDAQSPNEHRSPDPSLENPVSRSPGPPGPPGPPLPQIPDPISHPSDPRQHPPISDPRLAPQNWENASPPPPRKRTRWDGGGGNEEIKTKAPRWENEEPPPSLPPRRSRWEQTQESGNSGGAGLLPLPPDHQRLGCYGNEDQFEMERRFDVDPRMEPPPPPPHYGPRPDWEDERRRYEEEMREGRRSKMPKELREYIEATKRELRESSSAVDHERERRTLPLGYQSAMRALEERKERDNWRGGDRYSGDSRWERERERDSGYYRDRDEPSDPRNRRGVGLSDYDERTRYR